MRKVMKKLNTDNLTLDQLKDYRCELIDQRSGELIDGGHTYNSKKFSMSKNAQLNLLGLDNSRNELTYPVRYNTVDNLEVYEITDATEMHNFYLNALGHKKSHLDSGTDLKAQIRAATTKSEVDGIIDNR